MAIIIGLDAGHGLKTSGKQTPDGIKEWTLNDKVRDKVAAILSDYDVKIIHTDNDEGATDESLAARVKKYTAAGAAAFVSIHHNAYKGTWGNATGVEVYTDNGPTAKDKQLANCIYTRLVKYTNLKGRGVKQCDFYVINQDKIPAVLVEGGFMDGTADYKYITSDAGQTAYAKAVAEGLIEFLGLKKKKAATATTGTKNVLHRVQVGAYKEKANAEKQLAKIKAAGFDGLLVKVDGLYKVQIGAYSVEQNAENMLAKVKAKGFDAFITTSGGGTLAAAAAAAKKEIKVGSTVKVKKGAKTYTGGGLADFVYSRKHKVSELKGDRAVITYNGAVVAAVKKSDLILQ